MALGFDDLKNMDDVKAVWDNLEAHDWQGLFNAIRKVRAERGNNETLDKLEELGQHATHSEQPFPDSPKDLMQLLQRNA